MAIKCKTSTDSIKNVTAKAADILNEEMANALSYLGEECVKRIRENPDNWQDQTGNLRSSIGYAVCNYGRSLFKSKFEKVIGKDGNGSTGSLQGQEYVEQLAQKYTDVYTLVVVAGMDYAEYLELCLGRDVLQGTEVWAKAEIEKVVDVFYKRAERKINALIKAM